VVLEPTCVQYEDNTDYSHEAPPSEEESIDKKEVKN
jgi:hypothetical protein